MNIMKYTIKTIILLFLSAYLYGQEISRKHFEVEQDGSLLDFPFVGGLHSPQISTIDLNQDGIKDWIIFDRVGDVVLPFLRSAASDDFEFAPKYAQNFPDVKEWMLMRDFDDDGLEDLFHFPLVPCAAGIEVHKTDIQNDQFQFESVTVQEDGCNLLLVPLGSIETQVYVSTIDIPDIRDIDDDGDLDIIAFDEGGSRIVLYDNLSVDQTGAAGLDYIRDDVCFGKLFESGFSQDISLGPSPDDCSDGFSEDPMVRVRHSGSAITLFDPNGDGLLDLLVGDISNDQLVFLENNGTKENTWFSEINPNFPNDENPVKINVFNMGFSVDVNGDGLEDIVAAQNQRNALQTTNHIWYYENVGGVASAQYELRNNNFLIDEMLSFGSSTYPAFLDYNADGLLDIVVGSKGKTNFNLDRRPRMVLLENVGTKGTPKFLVKDEDYLGFSQFSTTSQVFAPSIGDLDGDGDQDMIIGDDRGFFYYLENTAGPEMPLEFADPIYEWLDLKVGQFVTPQIIDLTGDGLGDLVVGERNNNTVNGNTEDEQIGSLNFLENIGSVGAPEFSDISSGINTQVFGGVNTKVSGFIRNFSAPAIVAVDEDFVLMTGSESGQLFTFTEIKDNLDGDFTLISKRYGNIKEGRNTSPAIADIDNDGFYDVLIGNLRGGLSFYSTEFKSGLSSDVQDEINSTKIEIYPNPVHQNLNIQVEILGPKSLEIYSATGHKIISETFTTNNRVLDLNVNQLLSGIYFIRIKTTEGILSEKFVKM